MRRSLLFIGPLLESLGISKERPRMPCCCVECFPLFPKLASFSGAISWQERRPVMKNSVIVFLLVLSACLRGRLLSQSTDVSQVFYTATNDISVNGVAGQTFTATTTSKLHGIRLWVEAHRRSAADPFGSAFTINLRKIIAGKVQDAIIASGTMGKESLQLNVPVMMDVYFNTPYDQTAGELLAFTIQELSGGGANGWNEYAMISTNPYERGTQFYSFNSSIVLPTTLIDLAFATIIRPASIVAEERVKVTRSDDTGEYTIDLADAENGKTYVIEESLDMVTWHPGASQSGTGGELKWIMNPGVARAFYRLKVQE